MLTIILGLTVGLAFGYTLQRGRFCINTAFRDILLIRDSTLLRAWALAVIIPMLGLQLVMTFGLFTPDIPPFFGPANIVGGFLFGIGMVLAGGCASGTCYRAGEGMLASLIALFAFGFMTVVTDSGALRPLQDWLRVPLQLNGQTPTLPQLLPMPSWLLAVVIAVFVSVWLIRAKRVPHQFGLSWLTVGFLLGGIGIVGWLSSSATGRNYGLSITGPLRSIFQYLITGDSGFLDWGSYMLLGLIVGGGISAALHREIKLRLPPPRRLLQALAGGLVMGFGAQVAGGCNIGHSITGLAVFSIGSVITTGSIVLGAWTLSFFLFMDGVATVSKWLPWGSISPAKTRTTSVVKD